MGHHIQRMWIFFSCSVHIARDQYVLVHFVNRRCWQRLRLLDGLQTTPFHLWSTIGNAADEGDDRSDDEHEKSDDDEPIEEQDQEETALSDLPEIISHWRR